MLNHSLIPSLKRRGNTLGILLVIAAVVAALVNPVLTIAGIAIFLAIWFLVRNLDFGLLILVFFFPYLGLVIDFGQFEIFRDTVYLKNINAPFIDLYGLLLFIAWLLRSLLNPKSEIRMTNQTQMSKTQNSSFVIRVSSLLPYWKSYLLFWLSGLVSLFKVPSIFFAASFKYFARPFTFAYLVFFAMPVSILTRRHNPTHPPLTLRGGDWLHRVLMVFFWTGLLSAANGLLGLLFSAHEGFPRATPFGFFGINPLGPNHNLLAETLIATAPAGLILAKFSNFEFRISNFIKYGMWFQWAIALLTFARTAWIAVAAQAIVYFVLRVQRTEYRGQKSFFRLPSSVFRLLRAHWMAVAIVVLAIVVFLGATVFSETVRGSTLSRLDQARIAAFYFERAPIFGQGIGTFVPTLWQTKAYLLEYGEPLEAHGILFKLAFEQGIFGIAAFGVFVGAILVSLYRTYRANRTDRTYKTALIVALMIAAGSLTYQLFNTTYYTSKLWVPLAIAVAIVRIKNHES